MVERHGCSIGCSHHGYAEARPEHASFSYMLLGRLRFLACCQDLDEIWITLRDATDEMLRHVERDGPGDVTAVNPRKPQAKKINSQAKKAPPPPTLCTWI